MAVSYTHLYMTKRVTLVKTLYYVPCIITTVAITQLFRSIYSTEPMGLLNQFLQAIGLDGMVTSWLAEVSTALTAVSDVYKRQVSVVYALFREIVYLKLKKNQIDPKELENM